MNEDPPVSPPLQHLLFGSLGRSLARADPPESERLTILNEAWKVVTKVHSPQVPRERRCRHSDLHYYSRHDCIICDLLFF